MGMKSNEPERPGDSVPERRWEAGNTQETAFARNEPDKVGPSPLQILMVVAGLLLAFAVFAAIVGGGIYYFVQSYQARAAAEQKERDELAAEQRRIAEAAAQKLEQERLEAEAVRAKIEAELAASRPAQPAVDQAMLIPGGNNPAPPVAETPRAPQIHPLSLDEISSNLKAVTSALRATQKVNDPQLPLGPAPAPEQSELLSWRVHLLPALGLQSLHARFRLNEPWNSEHNLPLVQEIPPVFRDPESEPGNTCIRASLRLDGPVAERTLLGSVTDGLNQTI